MVRRNGAGLVVAAVLAGVGSGWAQTHKVETPEAVVRAVGVYEWTGELGKPTASRLIPVTIFINGELEDGAVYRPRPIPFALLPGNEYVLQQAGVDKGLLVLNSASKTPGADEGSTDGWWGYGTFRSLQEEKAAKLRVLKDESRVSAPKEEAPESRKGDPDRPTLRRRSSSGQSGKGGGSSKTDSGSSTGSGGADTGAPPDDPDRPVLKKRGGGDAAKSGVPQAASASDSQEVATEALNRDPDRPVLHRGKPANGGVADTPDAAVGAKLMSGPAASGKAPQQMVAVSDAKNRPEHDFARAWEDAAEQKAVLAEMETMARAKLAAYTPDGVLPAGAPRAGVLVGQSGDAAGTTQAAAAPGTTKAAATPRRSTTGAPRRATATAHTRAGAAKRVAAAAPVPLLNEDLRSYELSYGGAPTFVLTAHTGGTGAADRYVTVVAQRDLQGKLVPAFSSVTDGAHLDRVAAMRLVGAVDAEASNRASLLFELREPAGRQFALVRVLGGRSETIFTTGVTP